MQAHILELRRFIRQIYSGENPDVNLDFIKNDTKDARGNPRGWTEVLAQYKLFTYPIDVRSFRVGNNVAVVDFEIDTLSIYSVEGLLMSQRPFKVEGEMRTKISPKPIGCVMDMCKDKRDFSFKIRTGDISPDVMNLIQSKKIKPSYMNQLISIFEKVRMGVLFRERVGITNGLTRIELREFGKKLKLVLVDFGDLPLSFEPLETSIYLMYLKVPKGIRLQDFDSEIVLFKKVLETVSLPPTLTQPTQSPHLALAISNSA